MPADSERSEHDGISRRQVLARGAVAAGVIWAAPTIRTATAYATSSSGTERPCINFYLVCVDAVGTRPVRFPPDQPGYDDISPEAAALITTTSTSSTTSTTAPPTSTTTSGAAPSGSEPGSTSTTTTTTPPTPDDAAADPPAADAEGTDSTPPTTAAAPAPEVFVPPVDELGLFPDPAAVTPAPDATAAAPVDPHATILAAAQAAMATGTPDTLPPGLKDWLDQNPDVPVRYPTELPGVTQASDEAWAVTLARVEGANPLTHQCRVVNGYASSKGKFDEFFLDPDPEFLEEFGRRAIFPNPRLEELATDPTALIESVIFVFCCPQ